MSHNLAFFGLDGIRYLDEISDRNLVLYFRHELTRGAFSDLSPRTRRRLVINGILIRRGLSGWELTIKGKKILEGLRENPPSL